MPRLPHAINIHCTIVVSKVPSPGMHLARYSWVEYFSRQLSKREQEWLNALAARTGNFMKYSASLTITRQGRLQVKLLQPSLDTGVRVGHQRRSDTSDVIYISTWSWLSSELLINLLHSIASRTISGHQKLLVFWVHSRWRVLSAILKLSIRSRLITVVYLALNSYINAVWRSLIKACNVTSDWWVSITKTPLNPSWSLLRSISNCCIDVF